MNIILRGDFPIAASAEPFKKKQSSRKQEKLILDLP